MESCPIRDGLPTSDVDVRPITDPNWRQNRIPERGSSCLSFKKKYTLDRCSFVRCSLEIVYLIEFHGDCSRERKESRIKSNGAGVYTTYLHIITHHARGTRAAQECAHKNQVKLARLDALLFVPFSPSFSLSFFFPVFLLLS